MKRKTCFRPIPVAILPNPKFTKRGTHPQTALHGMPARFVRGFCRTERTNRPPSYASGTSTRSVKVGLCEECYSTSPIGTQMPDS